MAHWLKVEPKQSIFFFNKFISFSIIEDKVEHAIDVLEDESTLAWQSCVSKSFFKEMFSLDIKSKSFELEAI